MNGPKVGRKRCLREIWLYAGKPENPALLSHLDGDNASGADNQQERLLELSRIIRGHTPGLLTSEG